MAQSVSAGKMPSGWHHYSVFGYIEERPGVSDNVRSAMQKINPVPPVHLRKRVHGDTILESFETNGKTVANNLHLLISMLREGDTPLRILDFGCGCGRVIKFLRDLCGNCEFHGSDIDKEAIQWCKENLSDFGEFTANDFMPPLPFGNDYFDLIYSISVFTHLPEDMHFAWLEDLRRVTKPSGHLLLTTHDMEKELADSLLTHGVQAKGFHYVTGEGTEGLPDFYHTAYHTEEYIFKHWSKYFDVLKIIRRGIANHQTVVVCRKRP